MRQKALGHFSSHVHAPLNEIGKCYFCFILFSEWVAQVAISPQYFYILSLCLMENPTYRNEMMNGWMNHAFYRDELDVCMVLKPITCSILECRYWNYYSPLFPKPKLFLFLVSTVNLLLILVDSWHLQLHSNKLLIQPLDDSYSK